jgi:hypothetical protein
MRYFVMSLLFVASAGLAAADSSVPDNKKPPAAKKGKAGAVCKGDADCDQSGDEELVCRNKKCEIQRPRVMPNT